MLRVDEVAWPHPEGDQVLIRVHASSVNGTDLGLRSGLGPFKYTTRRPFIPGFDVAGEVVACGPAVTAFSVGDRVMSLLGHGGGGAAEYVAVRQARVGMAPASIGLTEAAALPLSGLTALQALRGLAQVRAGQRVLVYGASGGIGAYGVQLAKLYGAHVTGVARPEKLNFVRQLGADAVLSRDQIDFFHPSETWDVIFDAAPALRFEQTEGALTENGILVSVQAIPVRPAEIAATLRRSGKRFAGVRTAERGLDLSHLARLVDAGQLRVPLDRRFPLAQIADAHRYAEGDEVRGKVIVEM